MKHADWNMNVWKTLFLVDDTQNTEYGVQTNQKYVNVNLYYEEEYEMRCWS